MKFSWIIMRDFIVFWIYRRINRPLPLLWRVNNIDRIGIHLGIIEQWTHYSLVIHLDPGNCRAAKGGQMLVLISNSERKYSILCDQMLSKQLHAFHISIQHSILQPWYLNLAFQSQIFRIFISRVWQLWVPRGGSDIKLSLWSQPGSHFHKLSSIARIRKEKLGKYASASLSQSLINFVWSESCLDSFSDNVQSWNNYCSTVKNI